MDQKGYGRAEGGNFLQQHPQQADQPPGIRNILPLEVEALHHLHISDKPKFDLDFKHA